MSNNDIGIPKFKIDYNKVNDIDLEELRNQFVLDEDDIQHDYNPFKVKSFQHYNPTLDVFFKMDSSNYDAICLNNSYKFVNLNTVQNIDSNVLEPREVFIKNSPLLDPIKYMIGKYDLKNDKLRNLPQLNDTTDICDPKLLSKNNSSYVDGFFSFLSSRVLHNYDFKNGLDYFGSFLALQEQYKMNISDDYDYLHDSDFFLDNLNKEWKVTKYDMLHQFMEKNSRSNKEKLNISDEVLNIEDLINEEINVDVVDGNVDMSAGLEEVYDKPESEDCESTSEEDDENSDYDDSDGSDEDEEEDEDGSSEESNEITMFSYIKNFPVQMICLEKCDGTIDELFENETMDEEKGCSALLQVIMSLIVFQKAFQFTHNDLHTNNIMYNNTDIEFLYYKVNGKIYRVPTFGKIYKLIDFGRAIYKYQGNIYCSVSFAPGGDAATQYNCEPYYNDNKPVIEPNMSFDLCRLGCSIYDFIIEDEKWEDMDGLQKTVHRWCQDDNDLNVLYKKNGSERYPNFKLYKMIARTVHKHVPIKQLEFEFFNKYEWKGDLNEELIMDLDAVHSYV